MLVTLPAHRVIKGVAVRFTTILTVCCADYAAIRHRHKNNNIIINSLYFFSSAVGFPFVDFPLYYAVYWDLFEMAQNS